jgi:hypothetical protein
MRFLRSQKIREAVLSLKETQAEEMANLPRGSQKCFFRRMWWWLQSAGWPVGLSLRETSSNGCTVLAGVAISEYNEPDAGIHIALGTSFSKLFYRGKYPHNYDRGWSRTSETCLLNPRLSLNI